jgi:hypothetical protein
MLALSARAAQMVAAKESLKRMQKDGAQDISPDNEAQVDAFVAMRQWKNRISAAALREYMAKRTQVIDQGAKQRIEYFGVPKSNFPDGLPERVSQWELTDNDLEGAELLGGATVDRCNFFVIDQACERSLLGKNVRIFEFYAGSATRVKPSGELSIADGRPCSSGSKHDSVGEGPPDAKKGGKHDDNGVVARPRARELNRSASEISAEEPPEAKKARKTKEILCLLRDNINKAAARGDWNSANPFNQDTVKFWVTENLAALANLNSETMAPPLNGISTSTRVKTSFSNFLTRLFMENSIYEELHSFKATFPELESGGARISGEARLIEQLASMASDSDDMLKTDGIDVVARTQFYMCPLYKSFFGARIAKTVERARQARGDARTQELKKVENLHGLPGGMKQTITVASTLFSGAFPVAARLTYLADEPLAIKLATDWDADGMIGTSASLFSETPDFVVMSYMLFSSACREIVAAGLSCKIANPLAQAGLNYLAAVDPAGDTSQPWKGQLANSVLTLRLGLKATAGVEVDVDAIQEDIPVIYKVTKEFLALMPKGTVLPEWWNEWKRVHEARKQEKKEKSKKLSELAGTKEQAPAADGSHTNDVTALGNGAEPASTDADKEATTTADSIGAAITHDASGADGVATVNVASCVEGEAATVERRMYEVGDVVIGRSKKWKDSFNNMKCTIVDVLVKHYKVRMMEGVAEGELHKYFHECVDPLAGDAAPSVDTSSEAVADATGSTSSAVVVDATGSTNSPTPPASTSHAEHANAWMDVDDIYNA